MPPPPEFRDAFRKVGIVEVFNKVEPEDPPQPDGHIGIAGEIEIDLQRKGDGVHPAEQYGLLSGRAENRRELSKLVGQQDFLAQSDEKPPDAAGRVLPCGDAAVQLPGNVRVADNRPRNQLGKQRHIRAEIDRISLGRGVSPVYIHHIADALEGVEADADGQRQMQQRQAQTGDGGDIGDEKVGVFEHAQQRHAGHHGQNQPESPRSTLLRPSHSQSAAIENPDGEHHQQHIFRFAPAIEKQTRQQQNGIFRLPRNQKIGSQHRRKEIV